MRRIWYVFIILLCSLNASWSLAAQGTLFESVQELDGTAGTSKGADWRLTDFANFALQNDNNDELYGHKVVSGSVTGDTLTLVLADASTILVDVTSLLDNTDSQTITTFNLNSSTNILTLALSGGNTSTVDLSGLVDTDGLVDASSDGTIYGRKDGTWVAVEPLKGADDNYVTDAEKTVLGNTSGTNTGDQDLSGKQDTLVSGTNIKTVNSTSILGSGDIVVEGVGDDLGDATATDITALFSGTGDYIKADGTKDSPTFVLFDPDQFNETGDGLTEETPKVITIEPSILGGAASITEATSTVYSDSPGDPGDMLWDDTKVYLRNNTGWRTLATLTDDLDLAPEYYSLSFTDPGNGNVVTCSDIDLVSPINCGNSSTDCSTTALVGSEVTGITATAATGYAFIGWAGDLNSSENPTTAALTINANKEISTNFDEVLSDCSALGTNSLYYDADHSLGTNKACISGSTSDVTFVGVTADTSVNTTVGGTYGLLWDGVLNKYGDVPATGLTPLNGRVSFDVVIPDAVIPGTHAGLFEWHNGADYIRAYIYYVSGVHKLRFRHVKAGVSAADHVSSSQPMSPGPLHVVVDWNSTTSSTYVQFGSVSSTVSGQVISDFTTPSNGVRYGEDTQSNTWSLPLGFDNIKFGASQQ